MLLYLTYPSLFSLFGYGSILWSVLVFTEYVMSCHSLLLKEVLKVILIKAQNKHTPGNSKTITTWYLLGHTFNKPLHFYGFFPGSRCYCCIEECGEMETLLHLSSEPQSHFCRLQSKNKQAHNTYKPAAKMRKKLSAHGHTQYWPGNFLSTPPCATIYWASHTANN